jgi:hypothetical protein
MKLICFAGPAPLEVLFAISGNLRNSSNLCSPPAPHGMGTLMPLI